MNFNPETQMFSIPSPVIRDGQHVADIQYPEEPTPDQVAQQILALRAERSQVELETAKLEKRKAQEQLLTVRSHNRPSVQLRPVLSRVDGQWELAYHDFRVYGDTPDLTMDNFDYRWIHG